MWGGNVSATVLPLSTAIKPTKKKAMEKKKIGCIFCSLGPMITTINIFFLNIVVYQMADISFHA